MLFILANSSCFLLPVVQAVILWVLRDAVSAQGQNRTTDIILSFLDLPFCI